MDYIYYVIVGILFLFAISDLIVGVTNDAVNFLNSAVGAKAASFRFLLVVASFGLLIGAIFSGGMMEVARSGIFHPTQFYFHEIMLLFLAVMITDVLLLDFFNTLGLPTSTTVSLVFELLGAAFVFSIIKIIDSGETLVHLSKYINTEKAFAIISAIFISIAIAFTIGFLVMWITRVLFSFVYNKKMLVWGSVFSGISVAVITYFIFLKGLKDVSFIPENYLNWINTHVSLMLLAIAAIFSFIFFVLQLITKINVLKIVVFFGTFALAMAFAGNDLVNFVGVPLAGLKSFQAWVAGGGGDPQMFSMEVLAQPVKTPFVLLLLAGVIMILSLWFSKKARTVINTSVDLSRQKEGDEQFGANQLSRAIVRFFYGFGGLFGSKDSKLKKVIDKRFEQPEVDAKDPNPPAFDMLRAAMNLMVASSLIAFGTSLKLPLSTTYVTFMVAMGTSLADRSWGRESAVYRVSGVFTVIGGWFLTAFTAFTVSSIVALILYWGDIYAIAVIVPLMIFILLRTHKIHKKKDADKKNKSDLLKSLKNQNVNLEEISCKSINEVISQIPSILDDVYEGLKVEDHKAIKATAKRIKELDKKTANYKTAINEAIKTLDSDFIGWGEFYLKVNESLRGIVVAMNFIAKPSQQHISNLHKSLNESQMADFASLKSQIYVLLRLIQDYIAPDRPYDSELINKEYSMIMQEIDIMRKKQIDRISRKETPSRSSMLFLNILSELKFTTQLLVEIYETERERINNKPKS